ncbi:LPS export ABC transporter periplasmic protein LptC [Gracilinema caldarium]|uniref:LPS export ABC transporter periplasmic protein LptC n=1 Tax=Gracilinema caldarium TaxID=215591 RepID=UPI0026E9B15D|nr:LPS export ABC transporter periplasmic protein LptC [Gracilinema caldarium]
MNVPDISVMYRMLPRYVRNLVLFVTILIVSSACSFDYSSVSETESERPDLVMQDVDYVRVKDGKITLHMQADQVDRFEQKRLLQVQNIRFEQFSKENSSPEAVGSAGYAQFWTATSDASFAEGVRITVNSEDLSVEASTLQWNNGQKKLFGPQNDQVLLKRKDGSILSGKGFSADGRSRSWTFAGPVSGTYQEEIK